MTAEKQALLAFLGACKDGGMSAEALFDAVSEAFGFEDACAKGALVAYIGGLEMAAKKCEAMHDEDRPGDYADAIRSLKPQEPQPAAPAAAALLRRMAGGQ